MSFTKMELPVERKTKIFLYVLQLKHGCYYVGQSIDAEKRIAAHFRGKGSAWTKLHRPIEVISTRPSETRNWKHAEEIENQLVLMMMREYGWQRVRGGFWSNTSEEDISKNLLHHEQYTALAVSRPLDQEPQEASLEPSTTAFHQSRLATIASPPKLRPIKAGQSWTSGEYKYLLHEFNAGHALSLIAATHGRTEQGIAARLVLIGRINNRSEAKRKI